MSESTTQKELRQFVNLSANAIRERLAGNVAGFIEQVQQKALATPPQDVTPKVVENKMVISDPLQFKAREFSPSSGSPAQPVVNTSGEELFIVVVDGVAKYYKFAAVYDSDV